MDGADDKEAASLAWMQSVFDGAKPHAHPPRYPCIQCCLEELRNDRKPYPSTPKLIRGKGGMEEHYARVHKRYLEDNEHALRVCPTCANYVGGGDFHDKIVH